MAIFTNASFLGVDQKGEFFGDSARYKTIKTFSIEGFVDSRASNSDLKGVTETVNTIKSLINSVNSEAIMEGIVINGSGYGTGRITSLEFNAAPDTRSSQIQVGSYSAQIEFYSEGDLSTNSVMDGVTVPYPQFLEDFSESFSFSRNGEEDYEYSHDLEITYISGVDSNGNSIDPLTQAKNFSNNIFEQTLVSFDGNLGSHYGDYDSVGKTYLTESYNTINGSTSFSKKKNLIGGEDKTNYGLKVTNSYSHGQDGVINVSERGEIVGRVPLNGSLLERSKSAMETEIANSFTRCNNIYTTYNETDIAYKTTYASMALNSRPVSISREINNNASTVSYDVEYTDDVTLSHSQYTVERNLELNKKGNIYEVSENGTFTSYLPKGENWMDAGYEAVTEIPTSSTSKARCQTFYSNSGGTDTLKLISSSSQIPKYGKQFTYTYQFTDDPEVMNDGGLFTKKQIKVDDKPGVMIMKPHVIPNAGYEFIHLPDQTDAGTRNVEITATLKRDQYTNNLIAFRDPTVAINQLKADAINEAYKVFVDHGALISSDKNVIRITNASYQFTSKNEITLSVEVQYVMERAETQYRSLLPI